MNDKYLITYQKSGKTFGRFMHINTRSTSAEAFGEIQRQFAKECGAKGEREYAALWRIYENCRTESGVYFNEELAGPNGMVFTLFATADVSTMQIYRGGEEIREKQDVVQLRVLNVHPVPGDHWTQCSSQALEHSPGAIRAAEIITGAKYGEASCLQATYGAKTTIGIADIIENQARVLEMQKGIKTALEVLHRIVDYPACSYQEAADALHFCSMTALEGIEALEGLAD